jgi:SAM-dependent MidA family methyltransferase
MRESFRQFMQRALYDPQHGYYTARLRTVGARGDFSTSATLSTELGRAIGRWLRAEAARTGITTVIEIGGGDGSLLQQVRRELGWWARLRWRFCMVETSPVLRAQQMEKVGTRRVQWFTQLQEALASCAGRALLYHNELLDAFPVDLVQWDAAHRAWRYVMLEHEATQVSEHLGDAATATAFSLLHTASERPGVRGELHSAVREWLQSWLPEWHSGTMLTVDYGDLLPALYHRRPRGTLRGYLLQQRMEGADLYANPGRQDITSDINFTDLRAWLTELGCREQSYQTQAQFLHQWLGQTPSSSISDLHGAGAAFKCLCVER